MTDPTILEVMHNKSVRELFDVIDTNPCSYPAMEHRAKAHLNMVAATLVLANRFAADCQRLMADAANDFDTPAPHVLVLVQARAQALNSAGTDTGREAHHDLLSVLESNTSTMDRFRDPKSQTRMDCMVVSAAAAMLLSSYFGQAHRPLTVFTLASGRVSDDDMSSATGLTVAQVARVREQIRTTPDTVQYPPADTTDDISNGGTADERSGADV